MQAMLGLPVISTVAFVHWLVQAVAPSNLLVRGVRTTRPRLITAVALVGLAAVLFVTMHVAADAASAGAPGWLNLVVMVLAWDAIKLGVLASVTVVRSVVGVRCARPVRDLLGGSRGRVERAREAIRPCSPASLQTSERRGEPS